MCGPHFFSMRVTEDVRRYAAEKGLSDEATVKHGLEEKAAEFAKAADVYQKSVTRMSMNTRLSGSARVDDIKGHPQGEIRGLTKLVKITEDVRKYAAEQGVSEQEALQKGMEEKSREFQEKGAVLYARTK